ncbi:hypothetical protein BCR36DRAFT_582290 [Piromyces finnis]|uniref:NodB homology domain-containing protein n=1 Tax=Piromyces finnis TaxID=1754191 RepID=A0A1Y1VEF0_9FUNG|nr:hypothetical protein BCR36DRAFT_582290 [Piromyces finnis]|eukprot:ORX52882.1 hypothetical protein BCR36DRAFT_582290 [Piromyces finnis]
MNVLEYQEAMKKAHDAGYQIASHTFNHKISEEEGEFKEALDKMDDFIEKVTGDRPKYLRAPKGKCDHECQERVDQWDYQLIQWDVDTKDWDLKSAGSPENRVEQSITILKEKFAEEKDNYLILMHDTEEYTVSEIVPWIIEESGMKEKGYRFVSVAECLGDKSSMYASGKVYDEDPKESHQDNPQSIENELLSSLKDPIEPIDPDIDSIVYSDNLQHLNSSAFSCKAYPILLFFFHLFLIYYLYLYL